MSQERKLKEELEKELSKVHKALEYKALKIESDNRKKKYKKYRDSVLVIFLIIISLSPYIYVLVHNKKTYGSIWGNTLHPPTPKQNSAPSWSSSPNQKAFQHLIKIGVNAGIYEWMLVEEDYAYDSYIEIRYKSLPDEGWSYTSCYPYR